MQTLSISLTPLKTHHLDAFWAWASDPVVTQPLLWDAWVDRAAAAEFLRTVVEPHPWWMGVVVNGEVVGAVTLDRRDGAGRCRAELGYVLARAHHRRGVMTAAVRQTLARGFGDLQVERIEAFVDPGNVGSIGVLERAGLAREATLRRYVWHRGAVRDRHVYVAFASGQR